MQFCVPIMDPLKFLHFHQPPGGRGGGFPLRTLLHHPHTPAGGSAEQAKSGPHRGERFYFSLLYLGLKCIKDIIICQNDVDILKNMVWKT